MKSTTVIFALICIGLATAQWPCQDWGYNGPKPNCAGCTFLGSGFASSGVVSGQLYSTSTQAFSVCTSCTVGFFLNQSACAMCTPGCDICNPNGACTSAGCQTGFYFYAPNATCLSCPAALNCTHCALTTADWFQYQSYFNGNWLNLAKQHMTTSSSYWDGGVYTCTACGTGWYQNDNGGCSQCPTGSTGCSADGVQLFIYGCNAGYYSSGTNNVGACTACPANCVTCSSAALCTGGNFALTTQSSAPTGVVGSGGDQIPSALSIFYAVGQACVPGYYQTAAATCSACGTGTIACTTATNAIVAQGSCTSAYVVNSVTSGAAGAACVAIATTLTNCLIPDPYDLTWAALTNALCAVCMPGYVLVPATKLCIACPVNCSNATYDGSVISGLSIYNGGFNGYCSYASTSNTTTVCYKCAINTTLVQTDILGNSSNGYTPTYGGYCAPLPGNCSEGQATTSTATLQSQVTCNVCYPGFGLYWMSPGIAGCRPCLTQGCVSCDWTGVCQQCNVTQYLPPNQCLQCPYNCSVCANATYCYNNCTKNYAYNAALGQCLPTGAERIALGLLSIISIFLYFL